ncbi:hypothetical protein H3143_00845 [Mycoplasma tullyi]|uniref:HAD hydrolase family protein n=1 Tax=Mycoplasma tullyi TaxID=1612150 RepID=A0A7D7Y6W7_9MOLU|nr:hypothetical protein [Mycoplasma tullyi]QMT98676.1 hypothetical protein H3143_00845 [Mycoplasma tullyi]
MDQNKLLIIDVDQHLVYDQGYDIDQLTKTIQELKEHFEILISSSSWFENIINFNNLIKLGLNDISYLAANGACLRKKSDQKFYYEAFFKKNDYDLINHLALIKQSGILVKGASAIDSYDNVLATYILNYNTIKQARMRWKDQIEWNNDYKSFDQEIQKMLINQIYLFNIKEWINSPDFNQTILKHDRFSFIQLNQTDGLFINKEINKYSTIKKHFPNTFLIYLSLHNQIDLATSQQFNYLVVPNNVDQSVLQSAHFVFKPNELNLLIDNLKSII